MTIDTCDFVLAAIKAQYQIAQSLEEKIRLMAIGAALDELLHKSIDKE